MTSLFKYGMTSETFPFDKGLMCISFIGTNKKWRRLCSVSKHRDSVMNLHAQVGLQPTSCHLDGAPKEKSQWPDSLVHAALQQ